MEYREPRLLKERDMKMRKSKILNYDWELGHERVKIKVDHYVYGGIYVGMYSKDDGVWDLFTDLTVNLPSYELADNEAFIKDSFSDSIIKFIKEQGLGEVLPEACTSGMCTYKKVAFQMERLAVLDKEGVAKYRKHLKKDEMLQRIMDPLVTLGLDDASAEFQDGEPVMEDGGQNWQGKDVYRHLLRECLTINKEGTAENQDLEPDTLSGLLKDAASFGLKLFKAERKAIQADSHSNGQGENNLH